VKAEEAVAEVMAASIGEDPPEDAGICDDVSVMGVR